jgi:hypothetical protein
MQVVGAMAAGFGVVAEEIDPTVQPVRQSFYVFVFLAIATILLLVSFLRHLRRARTNLGPAAELTGPGRTAPSTDPDGTAPVSGPAASGPTEAGPPGTAEDDAR